MFTLAFSPCPNDTFIFDALVNKKINTEGLDFEVFLEDVQTLNNWALQSKMDFTKMSYGVLPLILKNYKVLQSGGALGKGVGPLLVTKSELIKSLINESFDIETLNLKLQTLNSVVAIPGENTTAHLLFSLAFPSITNKKFLVFNEIENYVLQNENTMGVIIHENRFTYASKGLHKIIDLGNFWEETTQLPIPLGGIVANKNLDEKVIKQVDQLINKSLAYAFEHYPLVSDYVKQHAQEMEEAVMRQHIDLYVNNFSLGLGKDGEAAVLKLLEVYKTINTKIEFDVEDVFVR